METLHPVARSRAGRWSSIAIVVLIVAGAIAAAFRSRSSADDSARGLLTAVNALRFRIVEGRLSDDFEHRVLRGAGPSTTDLLGITETAVKLRERWKADGTPELGRRAGVALLAAGQTAAGATTLAEALRRLTGERSPLTAIAQCEDAALLTDFSAALLQRAANHGQARDLLLAFESADRAWRLTRSSSAAWNRALAAERIGLPVVASRAWQNAVAADAGSTWSHEASAHEQATTQLAAAPLPDSPERFFHRELPARATAILKDGTQPATENMVQVAGIDPVSGDHLASDTIAAVLRVRNEGSAADRSRVVAALAAYTRGRDAFENDQLNDAHREFTFAERELKAFRISFALLARDQRIRCQCSQAAQPACLEEYEASRAELLASGRYPWLTARTAYGRGQAFYRRGRIYEAAEWFQQGHDELQALNDVALLSLTSSMLANAYAAAGETDVALDHFLEALRTRSADIGDRRRRQIEDVILFMLHHGFLSTAELLIDEMTGLPSTIAGRVMESTLRGLIAARRGDAASAATHFERAHVLLTAVKDEDARTDVQRYLAIAESGAWSTGVLSDLDAAVAEHEHDQYLVWLPQLLAKRGSLFEQRNEPERAEADYRRAIEILEKREPRIDETVLSLGVGTDQDSAFDRLIRLLLQQQRVATALSVAERASTLRISALHARGVGARDVFRASRGAGGGEAVAELQRVLPSEAVAVVQYLLRDELITWTVTVREIRAVRHAVRSQDLIGAVDDLRACTARSGCPDDDALELVSDVLLRDWIVRAPRDATLWFQPPAELQAVPFAMLKTRDGVPLLDRNAVATAPSLRAFVRAVRLDTERAGKTDAFFAAAPRPGAGRDPLPLAVSEATRASEAYTHARVETHATRSRFLEQSPNFSIVHFAGHVVVNDQQPLLSALVFDADADHADSQMLLMHELDEHSFARARMVVLSGCETGRAPRPTMSMANALLSQSVPSVVYTSWPVEDAAAEEFAIAFHRAIAAGRSRAAAVREAGLALRRAHPEQPHWWAAFALAGASSPLEKWRKGVEP